MYFYLVYFFIYAFLGWCTEVVFAAVNQGKFVNRGFLNGPVCPIYGFGLVAVVLLLTPLKENLLLLYLGSVVVTSLIELVTGYVMEKLFHQRWWDYSKQPLNIGGYVCLKFSLLWGFACILIVDVIHPLIAGVVSLLPTWIGWMAAGVFSAMIVADTVVTVISVNRMNQRLKQLEEVGKLLHSLSDSIGGTVAETAIAAEKKKIELREGVEQKKTELLEETERKKQELADAAAKRREEAEQRREALLSELSRRHGRFMEAFPDLRSVLHSEALEQVKEQLQKRKQEGHGAAKK